MGREIKPARQQPGQGVLEPRRQRDTITRAERGGFSRDYKPPIPLNIGSPNIGTPNIGTLAANTIRGKADALT